MKSNYWIVLMLLIASIAESKTSLSGNIGNVTFTKDGNPYVVENDLTVLPNKTMSIKEGCVFLFKPFTGLTVNGSLYVEGTSQNPVVFVSYNDSTYNREATQFANPFDWKGIIITQNVNAAVLSNFILKHTVFGIKSSIVHIVIRNGTFSQNGQFNFGINSKLMPVVDNMPFNYEDAGSAGSVGSTGSSGSGGSGGETKHNENGEPEKKKPNYFWLAAGITVGLAVEAAGVIYYFFLRPKNDATGATGPDNSSLTVQ
jgi:hypothetical protein